MQVLTHSVYVCTYVCMYLSSTYYLFIFIMYVKEKKIFSALLCSGNEAYEIKLAKKVTKEKVYTFFF